MNEIFHNLIGQTKINVRKQEASYSNPSCPTLFFPVYLYTPLNSPPLPQLSSPLLIFSSLYDELKQLFRGAFKNDAVS